MKMIMTAYAYPVILKGVVNDQLLKYFDKAQVKEIIKTTAAEYMKIVKRAPEIGGSKNLFVSNYLMGAYLIALYKTTKDKISIEQLGEVISNGLENFDYMKKLMQKEDLLSKEYKDKIESAGKWCYDNKDKYPDNWLVSVKDKEKTDVTHIVFTRCGLCALCKKENVPEFITLLCATDYITMGLANCKLERPTTLGAGSACCDFHITRK